MTIKQTYQDSDLIKVALPVNRVVCGDALKESQKLPNESIDMVMTSPPYYGLRDYGVKGQIGLESGPGEYVQDMMSIFQQL